MSWRLSVTRVLSWMCLAAGLLLVYLGVRELFESRVGQLQAEREFAELAPDSSAARPSVRRNTPTPPAHSVGDSIGKLIIPRLGAELYVIEGINDRQLRRGPAHMAGTAWPGETGNCIIAGHRDTHFRVLKDIRDGDEILIETKTGRYRYRVSSLSVVSSDNLSALRDTDSPTLHLITCYPFYYVGNAPKRFIVEARLANDVLSSNASSQ